MIRAYRQVGVSNGLAENGRLPVEADNALLDVVHDTKNHHTRLERYQAVYRIQDVRLHGKQRIQSPLAAVVCEHSSLLTSRWQ